MMFCTLSYRIFAAIAIPKPRKRLALWLLSALLMPGWAQAGIIRDAELEDTLAAFSRPIFAAADIPAESVRLFIVQDPQVNAFVAGGLNIFIHTGLIRQAKTPGMLIGVIAHETGHIAGAHLSQLREKSSRAVIGSILGAAVGIGAMIGGAGQAGAGVIVGSQSLAQRQFFGEIRANESSADQASLRFLDAAGISATGSLEMFQTLKRLEGGLGVQDPYMRTHPLTTERITAMRNHVEQSDIPPDQVPAGFAEKHARMAAKLVAFSEPYETTLRLYPEGDTSVAARYARAIAEFRRSNLDVANRMMEGLLREFPKDPFFHDTHGQFLFEHGKLAQAKQAYAKAAALKGDSALILTDYAKTLLATGDAKSIPHALMLLERAKTLDDSYGATWRQLAIAYGKQGRMAHSYAALAEEALLRGDARACLQHIARARTQIRGEEEVRLALDDLERDAKTQLEKKSNESWF